MSNQFKYSALHRFFIPQFTLTSMGRDDTIWNQKYRGRMTKGGNFKIGAGIHDITGPAAGRVLLGYSMPNQKTAGIHMRLWSRALLRNILQI